MKNLFDHFGEEYADSENFDATHKELNAINSELIELNMDRLEAERAIFEATRPKLEGYKMVDGVEVAQMKSKTTSEITESYRGRYLRLA